RHDRRARRGQSVLRRGVARFGVARRTGRAPRRAGGAPEARWPPGLAEPDGAPDGRRGRRDVSYGLLAAVVPLTQTELHEALRSAVDQLVLVPARAAGTFRFRDALLAEAMYRTLLPGEREAVHTRLAATLQERPHLAAAGLAAGELAHHWAAAAGRPTE